MTEGDLATVIWRACTDAGHPIGVPASRHAADAALTAVAHLPGQVAPKPPLMVELHERVLPSEWENPGLLATVLRRHADRLDARAHDAMMAAS